MTTTSFAVRAFVAFTLVLVGVTAGLAEAPSWTLAWEDDFDTFDESRWIKVEEYQPTNNSLQDYLPDQVTVEQGRLVITATDENPVLNQYKSGQVRSRNEQRLGRWEARAKMPTTKGMWPAIWLLPEGKKHLWPSGGEIDIMENRGNEPLMTSSAFHYGARRPFKHQFKTQDQWTSLDGEPVNYHDSFHTYAVDWTDRYLRFYVDGVNYFTVHDEDVDGFLSEHAAPMRFIINNAIGGTFLPNPDETTRWPQRMEIDWVRAYELDDAPGKAVFANGGFEADGGSLAGWTLFEANTASPPNASVVSQPVKGGARSLRLTGNRPRAEYCGVSQGVTVAGGESVKVSLSLFVRSQETLGDNRVLLKIEFYDAFGAKYGSSSMLGQPEKLIADASAPTDRWIDHEFEAVAPEGAVEARVVVVYHQPGEAGGAVHLDDLSLEIDPATGG